MSSNEIKVIDTWTQKGHSVYCKDFGPFLSLQQHSYNMNRFLVSHNQYNDNQIANWFHLASGINKVDYSSDLFDFKGCKVFPNKLSKSIFCILVVLIK